MFKYTCKSKKKNYDKFKFYSPKINCFQITFIFEIQIEEIFNAYINLDSKKKKEEKKIYSSCIKKKFFPFFFQIFSQKIDLTVLF